MNRGAWWAEIHRIAKSQTRLSNEAWVIISVCNFKKKKKEEKEEEVEDKRKDFQ